MRSYFILTGPTGIGKTEFGIEIASKFGLSILSIDSMLIYQKMNIGLAKPSLEQRKNIPHFLIDLLEPNQEFDVSKFVQLAEKAFDQSNGKLIGVGGTPFYVKMLSQNHIQKFDTSKILELYLEKLDSKTLIKWLKRLDPIRGKKIHINDRFRLIRALNIIFSSGYPASKFLPEQKANEKTKIIALHADRSLMHLRLKVRIDQMFSDGLLEEAKSIYNEYYPLSRTASSAVGYKELFGYFNGKYSLDDAKEKILVATRRLLKHQMTWFKKMDVTWVEVDFEHPTRTSHHLFKLAESHFI